jgi:Rieske Fe-S protein
VRLVTADDGTELVITGGEDHKAGEADDGDRRFARLEAWLRRMLPQAGPVRYRWSGQVMEPIDYAAFIGVNPGSENVYVATGDSGQGMTHGVVAGLLISELVVSGQHRWQALYDPARKIRKGLGELVSENATAVKNYAEKLMPGEISSEDQLQKGHGGLMRDGMKLVAVSRDANGVLHRLSANCTHAGCVVHWNSTELCWDCPCHGSHFAPDGSVLSGPAVKPLPPAGG